MLFQALWDISLSRRESNHGIKADVIKDGKIIIFLTFLSRNGNLVAYDLVVFRILGNNAQIKETLIREGQKYNVGLSSEKSQVSRYDSRLRVVLAKILCYLFRWTEELEYHEVKNELDFLSVSQLMDGSVRISFVILELFDWTNAFSKVNQKLNGYNQILAPDFRSGNNLFRPSKVKDEVLWITSDSESSPRTKEENKHPPLSLLLKLTWRKVLRNCPGTSLFKRKDLPVWSFWWNVLSGHALRSNFERLT